MLEVVDMSRCTKLKTIPQEAFGSAKKMTQLELPPNVESIQREAFLYSKSLLSVELPPSLIVIITAFKNSGLQEIVIRHDENGRTGFLLRMP